MSYLNGVKVDPTPEELFEKLTDAEKAAKISAHNAEISTWYGFCVKCGLKTEGKLSQFGKACSRCGHGG